MAESFAARELGPDTAHVSAETLRAGLATSGQYLLWTVLAEKDTVTPDHHWPDYGQPILRSARTLHAGGATSNVTVWILPSDISV